METAINTRIQVVGSPGDPERTQVVCSPGDPERSQVVGSPGDPETQELAEIIRSNLFHCLASPQDLEVDGDNYITEMEQFVNLQISDEDLVDILGGGDEGEVEKALSGEDNLTSPGKRLDEEELDKSENILEDITSVINSDTSFSRYSNNEADATSSPGPVKEPSDRNQYAGLISEYVGSSAHNRSSHIKGSSEVASEKIEKVKVATADFNHNSKTISAPGGESTSVSSSGGLDASGTQHSSTDDPGSKGSPIIIAGETPAPSNDGEVLDEDDQESELCALNYEDYKTCSLDDFQLLSNEGSELVEHGRRGRPPRPRIEKPSTLPLIQPRTEPLPVFSAPGSIGAPRAVAINSHGNAVYPFNGAAHHPNGGVVTCRFPVILKPDPANAASVHIQVCHSQGSFNSPSSMSNDGYLTSPPPTDSSECSMVKQGRASVKSDTSQSFSESNMSVFQDVETVPGALRQVSVDGPPARHVHPSQYPYHELSFNPLMNLDAHNYYMQAQSSQGHHQRSQNGSHLGPMGQQQSGLAQYAGAAVGQGQYFVGQVPNMGADLGHGQQVIGSATCVPTQSRYVGPQDPYPVSTTSSIPRLRHPPHQDRNHPSSGCASTPQNLQAKLAAAATSMGSEHRSLVQYQQQLQQQELMKLFQANEQNAGQACHPMLANGQHINNCQPSNVFGVTQTPHPGDCGSSHQLGGPIHPTSQMAHPNSVQSHVPPGAMANVWVASQSSESLNPVNMPRATHQSQEHYPNCQRAKFPGSAENVVSSTSTVNPKPTLNLPKEKKDLMVGRWIQDSSFTELDSGTYHPSDHSLNVGSTGGPDDDSHIIYGLDGGRYELQYSIAEKPKNPRKSSSNRSNSQSNRSSSTTKVPSTSKISVSGKLSSSSLSSARGDKSDSKRESTSSGSVPMKSSQYESLNNQIQMISKKPLPGKTTHSSDPEEEEKKRADQEIEKLLSEKRQQSLENKKAGVVPLDNDPTTASSLEQILNKSNVDMLSMSSSDIMSMPYINLSLEPASSDNLLPQPTKRSGFDYTNYITAQDIKSLEEQKAQNGKTSLDNYLNGGNVQEKHNGVNFSQFNGGPLVQLRRDQSDTCRHVSNLSVVPPSDPAARAPVVVGKNQIKAVKRRSQEHTEVRLRQEMDQAVQAEELLQTTAGSLASDYAFEKPLQGHQLIVQPGLYNPTRVVPKHDQTLQGQEHSTFKNMVACRNPLAGIPKLPKDDQLRDWVMKHQPQFQELSASLNHDPSINKTNNPQSDPQPNNPQFALQSNRQNKAQAQPDGELKIPGTADYEQSSNKYSQAVPQMLNRDDFKVPHSVSHLPLQSSVFPSLGGGSDISMRSDVSNISLMRQPGNVIHPPAQSDDDFQQMLMFKQRGILPAPLHPYQQHSAHQLSQQQPDLQNQLGQQQPYLRNQLGQLQPDPRNQLGQQQPDLRNQLGQQKSYFHQNLDSRVEDTVLAVSSVNSNDHHMTSRLQKETSLNYYDLQSGQRILNDGHPNPLSHQLQLPEMLHSSCSGSLVGQSHFFTTQIGNQQPSQPALQPHFTNISSPHFTNISSPHFTNISSPQLLHCGNSYAVSSAQLSPGNRNPLSAPDQQSHQGLAGKLSTHSAMGVTMETHLYTSNMAPTHQRILGSNSQNGYPTLEPTRISENGANFSQNLPSVQGFPISVPSTPNSISMTNISQHSYQERLDSSEDMLQDLLNGGFSSLDELPCNYDDMFLNSRGPTDNTAARPSENAPKPSWSVGTKAVDDSSIEKVAASNASSMEVSKRAGDSDVSVMTISYGSSDVELTSFEPDNDGETCLHLLCDMPAEHRERLAASPKFKGALNLLSRNGETALFIAVKNYKVDVVKFLLDHGADVNINCFSQEKSFRSERVQHTALHEAIEIGNQAVVEALLGVKDIQLDAKGSNGGLTPLMQALHIHKISKRRDIIMMLVKKEASLLQQDTIQGKTALMYAIQSHDVNLVEDILQMVGAEKARSLVTATDRKGNTCLHLAAGLQQPIRTDEKHRLLRCIILAGGDPSVKNNEGESARDWDRKNIAEVLQKLGRSGR